MKKKYGQSQTKANVLRILLSISETSGPYNQFCLPFIDHHNITLITLGKNSTETPKGINHISAANIIQFIVHFCRCAWSDKYDYVHIHHANLSILSWLVRKKTPVIFTLGTCYENLKPRHKLFLNLSIFKLNHLVCCSGAVRKSLIKTLIEKIMPAKIIQIDHAINLKRIPNKVNSTHRILIASRLEVSKNVGLVLEAYRLSGLKFPIHVYGEGSEKVKLAAEFKDEGITFHGVVRRDEILSKMSTSNFFISASDSDGLPIGVLEAAASNCTLILKKSEPHTYLKDIGFRFTEFNNIGELVKVFQDMNSTECLSDLKHNEQLVKHNFSIDRLYNEYVKLCRI